jgi:hypothetical protein
MLRQVIADTLRMLSFRRPSPAIHQHWQWFLGFGLIVTWLTGIGRYWDNPKAHLAQHLGLGSLIYVLVLALLLWILLYPLRPARWSLRNVLIFVTLCSPPALLYAIPVERFMSLAAAQSTNAWFLAIVASWRVALLVRFLSRSAQLSMVEVMVGTLLPIALIIVALMFLNLEHAAFAIMAGIAPENRSPADTSYAIVVALSSLSMLALPVLLIMYAALVLEARGKRPPS